MAAGTLIVMQPTITAVTPAEIEPGQTVQITGAHFGVTAGPRDPNTMFGVNDVMIGSVVVRPRRWKDDIIEVEVPANAVSGDVVVRLASSDPLPDGSCCAPVQYKVSNAVPLKLVPSIRVDPVSGPVGTKVVFFGQGFGAAKGAGDKVTFGGHLATIAQWSDSAIVVHLPMDAETGPIVLTMQGRERTVGTFTVHVPTVIALTPPAAPIGTLLRISGEHFGFYSESGAIPLRVYRFQYGRESSRYRRGPRHHLSLARRSHRCMGALQREERAGRGLSRGNEAQSRRLLLCDEGELRRLRRGFLRW